MIDKQPGRHYLDVKLNIVETPHHEDSPEHEDCPIARLYFHTKEDYEKANDTSWGIFHISIQVRNKRRRYHYVSHRLASPVMEGIFYTEYRNVFDISHTTISL